MALAFFCTHSSPLDVFLFFLFLVGLDAGFVLLKPMLEYGRIFFYGEP
ncbi:hypothetical protein CLU94_2977 [Janthinobacterium sp. 13]|nr:hypothetical protein CLU94_2977 [Janthinobacterium sp. 13]